MKINKSFACPGFSCIIIFLVLACTFLTPPPVSTPENQQSQPTKQKAFITPKPSTNNPTAVSTLSHPNLSSPTNTGLPSLPDFDDVLTFGGGGAEFGCKEYPPNSDQIRVEGAGYGSLAILCVFLQNVDPSVLIRIQLSQVGGGGIEIWSSNLTFDVENQRVLWDGYKFQLYNQTFEIGGVIDSWDNGNVKFALAVQLPLGLNPGDWQITIDRPGGTRVKEVFQINKEAGHSYINALDTRSRRELKPGWCCGQNPQLLQLTDNQPLTVMGTDYPTNTPVFVLVYKELEMGGYGLFSKNVMVTDDRGVIWGEIYQTFEVGSYILYGITNPDTLLGGENYVSCRNALESVASASCDYFIVMDIVNP